MSRRLAFAAGFLAFPVCFAAGILLLLKLNERDLRRSTSRTSADARLKALHPNEERKAQ